MLVAAVAVISHWWRVAQHTRRGSLAASRAPAAASRARYDSPPRGTACRARACGSRRARSRRASCRTLGCAPRARTPLWTASGTRLAPARLQFVTDMFVLQFAFIIDESVSAACASLYDTPSLETTHARPSDIFASKQYQLVLSISCRLAARSRYSRRLGTAA
jgi:hypothetical protein